jgi:tol-pal system protein YbgF
VAREIIDLQRDVTSILQGQKDMSTQMIQDHTAIKTVVGGFNDSVNRLGTTMSSLQKSVQDVQANSGARLETMSTQVQGLSDNLEEIKSRLGKLNQQLVDLQNSVQGLDAKISSGAAAPTTGGVNTTPTAGNVPPSTSAPPTATAPSGPAPSADMLYSNGLKDIQSGKYDLARSEFQDYLKYYGSTDLASNAQFYIGEIYYRQKNYQQAIAEYDKVINNYPKSFKLAPARLHRATAMIALGQKSSGIRELRDITKLFPGSEEDRYARAQLKELGASVSGAR